MTPVIFFRENKNFADEIQAAKNNFHYYNSRVLIPQDSLVIGRYSCLPFYEELEKDIHLLGSKLINSSFEHHYIADFNYYWDIQPYTFKTWFEFRDIPFNYHNKPFIVKGRTNSKKNQWKTKMFANNFKEVVAIGSELLTESGMYEQGLAIREYIPLETFEKGINDMPITNEWRIFFYKNHMIDYGYYWQSVLDDLSFIEKSKPDFVCQGLKIAQEVAEILQEFTTFFVIDMAKTLDGKWIVVEVNDGQQSGLNMSISPDIFYQKLHQVISQNI